MCTTTILLAKQAAEVINQHLQKRTASLQWTMSLLPMCPLFGGSTVHVRSYNNVTFRLHVCFW